MKSFGKTWILTVLAVFIAMAAFFLVQADASAQAAPAAPAAAAAPAAGAAAEAAKPAGKEQTFWDVIITSGFIGISIWVMLFASSIAVLSLLIDAVMSIRQAKLMPTDLVESVRASLSNGDLGTAIEACEARPCALANILMAGFNNVSEGFEVIMDSVSAAADIETEKLMQRVNFLNLNGAIAPMLGLMGTVTGMVDAFASLATMTGAEKAQALALSISQALYTTAVGLLVSIPAILGFVFVKNHATRLIMSMEVLTYDLIKVLKGAEVVDEEAAVEEE